MVKGESSKHSLTQKILDNDFQIMQPKKYLKDIIGREEVKGIEVGKEWELGFDSFKKKASSVCTPTQTEEFIIL